jgi:hypothetical protein
LSLADATMISGLDSHMCRQLLAALVDVRFLTYTPAGAYRRRGPLTPMTRFFPSQLTRRTLKTLLAMTVVAFSVFAAACGGTSIRKITADPSRYRTEK